MMHMIAVTTLAALFASLGLVGAVSPAMAECSGNPNRWPAFEKVAPTARLVVIGTVIGTVPPQLGREWISVFTIKVEDVLKGKAKAGDRIDINGLRSGVPLRGERTCRVASILRATPGDRIALAIDGRLKGVKGRVTTAAWLKGEPVTSSNPGLRRVDVDEIRAVMGLEPIVSEAGVTVHPEIIASLVELIRAQTTRINEFITDWE